MNAHVYEQITERIITLLAQGTVPWHKPWKARTGLPRNLVTKKSYRGINVFLLLAMSYESPFWLTFRQALQLGGNVRKSEKSCPVVFWKQTTIEGKEPDEPQKKRLLRFYHVFNVAQCDGLKNVAVPVESPITTATKPDEIVAHMAEPPLIKHGMTRAYYSPTEDCVGMPVRERFEREEEYYSTLFHELVHATGHETRLTQAGQLISLSDRAIGRGGEGRVLPVSGSPQLVAKLFHEPTQARWWKVALLLANPLPQTGSHPSVVWPSEVLFTNVAPKPQFAGFAGLRNHQYDCLWIRHSHLKRTELHFLVPRTELTTLKALNINPPRQRQEGLYDTFRKLINHDFQLKDPSGMQLSPAERARLESKLVKLVEARATYNRGRYARCTALLLWPSASWAKRSG